MHSDDFDLDAYLGRIGLQGPFDPTLVTMRTVVAAHVATIPYENIDVLLGHPPKLDVASLQAKLVTRKRGGYCFEQNKLLRAALRSLGFTVTSLIARVVRGFPADAPRLAAHMVLRVDLPGGPFLADVGFGNLTPTAPLVETPNLEQATPHQTMRLLPVGAEFVLQAKLGDTWENLWRLCAQHVLDADYDVANWFTATNPASPFVNNLIAARAGPDGTRLTFLNGRVSTRHADGAVERHDLTEAADIQAALSATFGLELPEAELRAALTTLAELGQRGATHPSFN